MFVFRALKQKIFYLLVEIIFLAVFGLFFLSVSSYAMSDAEFNKINEAVNKQREEDRIKNGPSEADRAFEDLQNKAKEKRKIDEGKVAQMQEDKKENDFFSNKHNLFRIIFVAIGIILTIGIMLGILKVWKTKKRN